MYRTTQTFSGNKQLSNTGEYGGYLKFYLWGKVEGNGGKHFRRIYFCHTKKRGKGNVEGRHQKEQENRKQMCMGNDHMQT